MLLQSCNNLIKVFPAVPKSWKNISFENLRAEGAFLVSAGMKDGKVVEIRIKSLSGGQINLKNPWKKTPRVISSNKKVKLECRKSVISWYGKKNFQYIIRNISGKNELYDA